MPTATINRRLVLIDPVPWPKVTAHHTVPHLVSGVVPRQVIVAPPVSVVDRHRAIRPHQDLAEVARRATSHRAALAENDNKLVFGMLNPFI